MSVIDDHLNGFSKTQKNELERVRMIVKQTVPEAEEVISYGMPGFKYKGKYLVGFNAFSDHLSLFPTSRPLEVMKDKLDGYKLSKGTIQFTPIKHIPKSLIKELLLIRKNDISNS